MNVYEKVEASARLVFRAGHWFVGEQSCFQGLVGFFWVGNTCLELAIDVREREQRGKQQHALSC